MNAIVPKLGEMASRATLAEVAKYYMLNHMEHTPRAKKVLYVITKSTFGGGAQRYVSELALASLAAGYTVAVAAGDGGPLREDLAKEGIKTFAISGAQRDISLTSEFRALTSLYGIIRDFDPDIIHLNSSKMGVLGSIIARLLGVPRIVFTAHGWPFLEPRPWWWRTMAWCGSYLTALLSHHTILVSQHDFRHTTMPGTKQKFSVIHTAVSAFTLLPRHEARASLLGETEASAHEHNVWIGTIGELNHNKNHTTLIDAIAEFNQTHHTKLLCGIISDGELRTTLEEQVSLRGLKDYVFFFGYRKDARRYLSAFDIFVLPSYKEGLPYALLEAGQAGLPTVASFVGGIPEVIINLETGLLIDPNNHMTIVAALEHLIAEPSARVTYATRLQEKVRAEYALAEMVRKTIFVYESRP